MARSTTRIRSPKAPADAALYYVSGGYTTSGQELLGIQSASEGVLRALARYADLPSFAAITHNAAESQVFADTVGKLNARLPTRRVHPMDHSPLREIGTLLIPGPVLENYAWSRRIIGSTAFSLVGITHATSTTQVMEGLAGVVTAPVEPWDAIVCTSRAVRDNVVWMIEQQEAHLTERFGKLAFRRPQLPLIPLGIECADFAPQPAARAEWRQRLGIGPDEVVVLMVGRMSFHTKMHPMPLFLAMERAAKLHRRPLYLIMAGWFADGATEQNYRAAAHALAPSVRIAFVDGRMPKVRGSVWSMGDIFVSPVDNIQESFGLTPLEAMAAGLPVVASDWDGYRDTLRDGIDGFLVPSIAPEPGLGVELGQGLATAQVPYEHYLGAVAQHVVIDVAPMGEAIARLAGDAGLRKRMGQAGQARARSDYDWRVIMRRYRTLWRDLAEIRGAAPAPRERTLRTRPSAPDPFEAFQTYPTMQMSDAHRIAAGALGGEKLDYVRNAGIVAFGQPYLPETAEALALLNAGRKGGTVAQILQTLPEPRRRDGRRSLLWLAKYDFLRILPPLPAAAPAAPKRRPVPARPPRGRAK